MIIKHISYSTICTDADSRIEGIEPYKSILRHHDVTNRITGIHESQIKIFVTTVRIDSAHGDTILCFVSVILIDMYVCTDRIKIGEDLTDYNIRESAHSQVVPLLEKNGEAQSIGIGAVL